MPETTLDGKTAIVTGASSGIGEATARTLASDGATVVLAARRQDRLDAIADELASDFDAQTQVVPTDVTDEAAVDSLVDATVEEFGGIDVLVSNAGIVRGRGVDDLATEEYHRMMRVNCDGTFFVTRAALPELRASDGNLVFVGSFAGQYPRPFNPVYAGTKWWTRGFAHSVEAAVGDDGVGVTVVNPSEVRSEFASEDATAFEDAFDPGEVTEPETVAAAIAFAARQDAPSTMSGIDVYRRDKFSHF